MLPMIGSRNGSHIVITADIAHRCIKAGPYVIAPTGRLLTEASIGVALATRNLMEDLRSAGQITGGPKLFQARDRSNFLSALDLAIVRLKRDAVRCLICVGLEYREGVSR
jgi:hypothetical protein